MKKLYLFFLFLITVLSGQSQETWGPPYSLTDSLTDNVNATLSIVPGELIQPDTLYMLWERSSDPLSTGIYARNLTTMAGPFMVAAQLNVHFKHPRVFRRGTGDTLFYFSYETNMNGNWDLFNIWESYRGGHWQLWATNMDILSGEKTMKGFATGMMKSSPNPFTNETHIEYFTGEPGSLTINIYDLQGKKIKTLTSTSEGNGKHSVT